jgi:Holliday junction resolvase
MPKYYGQRDPNEKPIVDFLEKSGWSVARINVSDIKGFPDLVAAKRERTVLIEVLSPEKLKKYRDAGGLSPDQVIFHRNWTGVIYCVEKVEDLNAIIAWEV